MQSLRKLMSCLRKQILQNIILLQCYLARKSTLPIVLLLNGFVLSHFNEYICGQKCINSPNYCLCIKSIRTQKTSWVLKGKTLPKVAKNTFAKICPEIIPNYLSNSNKNYFDKLMILCKHRLTLTVYPCSCHLVVMV